MRYCDLPRKLCNSLPQLRAVHVTGVCFFGFLKIADGCFYSCLPVAHCLPSSTSVPPLVAAHAQSKALRREQRQKMYHLHSYLLFFMCSFIASPSLPVENRRGLPLIGLHRSQHNTEFTAVPTGRRLRAIIISLGAPRCLVLGQATTNEGEWSSSVVSVVVVVLHLLARLVARTQSLQPSATLMQMQYSLNPRQDFSFRPRPFFAVTRCPLRLWLRSLYRKAARLYIGPWSNKGKGIAP